MFLIGESINVMSTKVREAFAKREAEVVQNLAKAQVEAGAAMLDINIGPAKKGGRELMRWVVEVVEEVVDVPLSLDTTNPEAMEEGIKACKKRTPLINSISLEPARLESMLPLAAEQKVPFVALLLTKEGPPRDVEERVSFAMQIIEEANKAGIPNESIYIDPIVFPVCADQKQLVHCAEFLRLLPELFSPPPKTICGLSNVSNGVPKELRPILNRTYLCMLYTLGLDCAIADVLDAELVAMVKTAKVLRNEEVYCHSWLQL
jgi:cobalamin-dependent methionine synthase I